LNWLRITVTSKYKFFLTKHYELIQFFLTCFFFPVSFVFFCNICFQNYLCWLLQCFFAWFFLFFYDFLWNFIFQFYFLILSWLKITVTPYEKNTVTFLTNYCGLLRCFFPLGFFFFPVLLCFFLKLSLSILFFKYWAG